MQDLILQISMQELIEKLLISYLEHLLAGIISCRLMAAKRAISGPEEVLPVPDLG